MEKEKSFFGHFLTIGFGTFVNMLLGLISTPILTRMVAPEVYGEYSIFSMYGSIAVMVLCLGLDQSLVRYYYQNDSRAYKIKLLRKCICLPLVIMPIVAGLFLLLVRFNIVVYDFNYFISFLLCVYCFIEVIARFSQLTLRLEYKSKIYSKVNVMKKLFYLIFVVIN